MIELVKLNTLAEAVQSCIDSDHDVLDQLRTDVKILKSRTRRIHPRSATAISLVGTDGGNNQVQYDPFMVQLIRVVDSSQNEHCLEVLTPTTTIDELNSRHLADNGEGKTPLGRMMQYLGVSSLDCLSPVFKKDVEERKPSWIQVYREMTEWAVLFSILREKDFGSDTVIVCDGFLRSKMFSGLLFRKLRHGIEEAITNHYENSRRRIYVAGIAKKSKVLQVYRLAMALEGVLRNTYPCYVEIDRKIEEKVYRWSEYARGDEETVGKGETNKFVAGKMFLVKFGEGQRDPVWAIDLLISQADEAATIFGYLLADAIEGFPVPLYPRCLQKAHENAALVDFDVDILQDKIFNSLRRRLGDKKWIIDELSLQEIDPSKARYH
jgi:hypothetical protein